MCCFIKSLPLNFCSVNNILFIIALSDLQKDFFLAFSFQNLYNNFRKTEEGSVICLAKYLTLTESDRLILESYKVTMDGLSQYLGEGYELILHSLEDLEHSVIKIINGHYTGRVEGAPITDFALSMLDHIREKKEPEALSYFNKKNGSTLKSTTIPILGENKRIIGLLCINFHMSLSFSSFLSQFLPGNPEGSERTMETFSDNVEDLISSALEDAKARILADSSVPSSNKNKEIISLLSQKGIFNMKDAVLKVAAGLGISKNTVYLHLRNLEKQTAKDTAHDRS